MKDMILIGMLRTLSLLGLSACRALGRFLAFMLRFTGTRMYKVTRRNIELIMPEASESEQREMLKKSIYHTGCQMAEIGLSFGSRERLQKRAASLFTERNEHILKAAMDAGKGVIVLAPHFGNWEMFTLNLPQYGRMMVIYKPIEFSEALEQEVQRCRGYAGVDLVPATNAGARKLFKHYRGGGNCFVLPDQEPPDQSGTWSTFFGVPAFSSRVIYNLVRVNPEGRVVIAHMKRVNGGFEANYHQPDEDIYSKDMQTSIDAMNRSMERCIREDGLEQYQWDYKRFKANPEKFYRGL